MFFEFKSIKKIVQRNIPKMQKIKFQISETSIVLF